MFLLKIITCLFFAFTSSFYAKSQPKDSSVLQLAKTLVQPTDNDSLKVLRFYDWITKNIYYDQYFGGQKNTEYLLPQEPNVVIARRKATCGGYAKLFKTFCATQNIAAEVIEGFAKSYTAQDDVEKNGHAWNVVQINHRWYLVDATWDACNGKCANHSYQYFAIAPIIFIQNHYPFDPMWQLLERPLSFEAFRKGHLDSFLKMSTFCFRDSILAYQSMDSLGKIVKTASRSYQAHPTNKMALVELGDFHFKKGCSIYEKYIAIRKTAYEQKKPLADKFVLFRLLDEAAVFFHQSAIYYRQLISLYPSNIYTDAHLNLAILEENLESLEEEKNYLKQYFAQK